MKKDRNYMNNYPVYPYPYPMNTGNDINEQINMINNKLASLERRISVLENSLGNYNSSNFNNNYGTGYQMM